ncbi:MAG: HDOD domain-containing protein [Kiritimatiellae bacterium]|nr:HDOD domain-containing protein [Kiritimatiellia bacterium]
MKTRERNLEKVMAGLQHQDLSTIPAVLQRIVNVSQDAKAQAVDLAQVCELDKSSSARILRAANSAYYSTRNQNRVGSIREAIVRIGFRTTQEIIMSAAVCNLFRANKVIADYSSTLLWKHSMFVGVANRLIYAQRFGESKLDPFVAGLLHDVGISIEHQFLFYDGFPEAITKRQENQSLLVAEEEKYLGLTHEEVGRQIAKRWNFPEHLVAVLGHHHSTDAASVEEQRLIHVTRLSELLCFEMQFGYCDFSESYSEALYASQERLGIDDESFLGLAQQLKHEIEGLTDLGWFSDLRVRRLS